MYRWMCVWKQHIFSLRITECVFQYSCVCVHNNILWPSEFCREAPSFILKACLAVKLKLLVTLLGLSLTPSSGLGVLASFPPGLLEGLPFSLKLGLRLHSRHNEAQKTNKKAKETHKSSRAHSIFPVWGQKPSSAKKKYSVNYINDHTMQKQKCFCISIHWNFCFRHTFYFFL